jgi:signal peptidase I
MSERLAKFENRLYDRFGPILGAFFAFVLEVVEVVVISCAIIVPVRYFLVQPFYVKGASMEPNFYDHEYLIIDEISFRFRDPERGEIIVFRYPRDPDQYFIKRVVGMPGETIEINNNRVVVYNNEFPNGTELQEEYLNGETTFGKEKVTLGENEYYVLGDNRDSSLDSRSFGALERNEVIGRVWLRGLPLSRIGVFEKPAYEKLEEDVKNY